MATSDERTRALLTRLEQEAQEHPRRHAIRLTALVLAGYLYPLALLAVSFAVVSVLLALAPFAWRSSHDHAILLYVFVLIGALLAAAAIVRAFWVEMPPPGGHPLSPGEARPLRELVDEVRALTGSEAVHHIHLDPRFNAAVVQQRRFAFWGRPTNYLIIGVPMLLALTPGQLRTVLLHETGHLRGRHALFSAWIYRIHLTWEGLVPSLAATSRLRWFIIGWFVERYGAYLSTQTMPLRRRHEYDADRAGAAVCGPTVTARTLISTSQIAYRLEKTFWPTVLREAGHEPLPPSDLLGRMAAHLASPPEPETLERWRRREQQSRSPVHEEHPCLRDRLAALGCEEMLDAGQDVPLCEDASAPRPDDSALILLGDGRERLWAIANALWKASIIAVWRAEHEAARQAQKASATPTTDVVRADDPDQDWKAIETQARYAPPGQARALLRDFVSRFPKQADANFTLGRLLLDQDDEDAVQFLETAMRHDSDYIGPALQLLLDYYRDMGRDPEADPIQERLRAHRDALTEARRERMTVSHRDRFLPHDLTPKSIETLNRILYQYPQIRAAYLVRKQLRLFTDKPGYALAIDRRSHLLEDNSRSDKYLANALQAQIPVPCAVFILGRGTGRLRSRILAACPTPVYSVGD
ncbi:MAG: M48 family metalloprotease [Phycisphaerae bacterium]|nr:M48 family metalloprotease [Phycisphaerae bacterium]